MLSFLLISYYLKREKLAKQNQRKEKIRNGSSTRAELLVAALLYSLRISRDTEQNCRRTPLNIENLLKACSINHQALLLIFNSVIKYFFEKSKYGFR